jgi:methylphosphotriester-DNA--protein-cysteine methyltransferase
MIQAVETMAERSEADAKGRAVAPETAWRAVLARDRSSDGRFVYAVRSTGIFCRPSCPSRRPHRRHVAFYATAAERPRGRPRPRRRSSACGRTSTRTSTSG